MADKSGLTEEQLAMKKKEATLMARIDEVGLRCQPSSMSCKHLSIGVGGVHHFCRPVPFSWPPRSVLK
eukprot:SAG31_NODE_26_length_32985_cov_39.054096_7_plen_68_part_00